MARKPENALRLLIVSDGDFTVHEDPAIAARPLDAAPFAAGQVMDDLVGQHGEILEIVDDDVGGRAFHQRTAIAEAGHLGRQGRQAPVRLLERDHAVLAHHLAQGFRRIATGGQELGVRSAV